MSGRLGLIIPIMRIILFFAINNFYGCHFHFYKKLNLISPELIDQFYLKNKDELHCISYSLFLPLFCRFCSIRFYNRCETNHQSCMYYNCGTPVECL